jgi:D-glycero-D-manno-heptose 1,7-bisphosphate phosphatase
MNHSHRAIFLDRDGVLIEDSHLVTSIGQMRVLPGVAEALKLLKEAGFKLIVITNQPAIARGILDSARLEAMHQHLNSLFADAPLDQFYFCPHHPEATVQDYRIHCECRKPKPGMLLQAASEMGIDLTRSFLVGDRLSDICAGFKAGVKTILVRSGCHEAPPIISDGFDANAKPDWEAQDLLEASRIILREEP